MEQLQVLEQDLAVWSLGEREQGLMVWGLVAVWVLESAWVSESALELSSVPKGVEPSESVSESA